MPEEYAKLYWYDNKEEYEKFINNLAPIVLFTYNRLEHTKKTIEALQQNVFAKESRLFIYSDAPKNEEAVDLVQSVREYLHSVDGFKEVVIVERDRNWGLAENIIDGVTKIVNEYGKIIVLEDDIVTSKYFLKYMNDALEVYKDEECVMAVSGFFWPDNSEDLPETFFLPWFSCWGWSTWSRAWDKFERNPEKLLREFSKEQIEYFNMDGSNDIWSQVIQNVEKSIYTWAVFFYAAIFKNNGKVLYSKYVLCINAGMDGTGEHCGATNMYDREISDKEITKYTMRIQFSEIGRSLLKKYFEKFNANNVINRLCLVYKKQGLIGVGKKVIHKIINCLNL